VEKSLDDDAINRRLPLLCSINPMGTPVIRLASSEVTANNDGNRGTDNHETRPGADADADVDATRPKVKGVPQSVTLRAILLHGVTVLRSSRRTNVGESRVVGRLLHAIVEGADWCFDIWHRWVVGAPQGANNLDGRIMGELYAEWTNFGGDIGHTDPMSALNGLVFEDAEEPLYRRFTDLQLAHINNDRPMIGSCETLKRWGGLTHWNIATFLRVQLHGTMRCVNVRSGLWFVYRHDQHRWEMDGPGVVYPRSRISTIVIHPHPHYIYIYIYLEDKRGSTP
jgi:hypothetical protein